MARELWVTAHALCNILHQVRVGTPYLPGAQNAGSGGTCATRGPLLHKLQVGQAGGPMLAQGAVGCKAAQSRAKFSGLHG